MSVTSLTTVITHASHFVQSAAPYLALGAFIFSLLALVAITILEKRVGRLMLGKNGTLEESLAILSREMKEAQEFRGEMEKYLKLVETRLRNSVQGVGIVRFNPFAGDGSGGNQSFAAAFLDEKGNGVVFSTLYARDRVGVYAKPLENGASQYEMSSEETAAIEKAKKAIIEHKSARGGK